MVNVSCIVGSLEFRKDIVGDDSSKIGVNEGKVVMIRHQGKCLI
jgi:hypothetical protein